MNDLTALVSDCITIEELFERKGTPVIRGTLLMSSDRAFKTLTSRLKPLHLFPILREKNEKVELQIREILEQKTRKPWINFVLFATTILTTILAGSFLSGANPFSNPKNLILGVPFSLALLLILGSHELGHYFACKSRGIQATLPYFIPVPPPIFPLGTFGAIIRIKAHIQDKKGLIEVGAAGPIIGFIFAVPIAILGLLLSSFQPIIPETPQILILGNSLIFWALTELFTNPPTGYGLSLHPIAFAGWVGMFITALNLLPVGQLDGGHISYALLGKKSKFVAWPLIGIMAILGIYWLGWLVWAMLILLLLGIKHPPPLDDITPLDKTHKIIGYLSLFIFIITFVPVPFQIQ